MSTNSQRPASAAGNGNHAACSFARGFNATYFLLPNKTVSPMVIPDKAEFVADERVEVKG
jgi:hypothetical protein